MSKFDDNLKALRDEIDDIDSQLVSLLVKRRAITTKVGELKCAEGMPIFAPEREAALISKRREEAEISGLSGDLIEDILRRLMRDSYVSQDASGYQCINPNCKKVVVVGGKGKLGAVFVDLFKRFCR
jgi:chorismate mutase/prephenate dehydrogenase